MSAIESRGQEKLRERAPGGEGGLLVCVGAALYTGLRLRVAVQAALYKLDLALDLVEFGVCLETVRIVHAWRMGGGR
jgi:hypothetical protein